MKDGGQNYSLKVLNLISDVWFRPFIHWVRIHESTMEFQILANHTELLTIENVTKGHKNNKQ